ALTFDDLNDEMDRLQNKYRSEWTLDKFGSFNSEGSLSIYQFEETPEYEKAVNIVQNNIRHLASDDFEHTLAIENFHQYFIENHIILPYYKDNLQEGFTVLDKSNTHFTVEFIIPANNLSDGTIDRIYFIKKGQDWVIDDREVEDLN